MPCLHACWSLCQGLCQITDYSPRICLLQVYTDILDAPVGYWRFTDAEEDVQQRHKGLQTQPQAVSVPQQPKKQQQQQPQTPAVFSEQIPESELLEDLEQVQQPDLVLTADPTEELAAGGAAAALEGAAATTSRADAPAQLDAPELPDALDDITAGAAAAGEPAAARRLSESPEPSDQLAASSLAGLAAAGVADALDDIAAAGADAAGEPAAARPLSEVLEPTSKDPTLQPPGILLAGAAAQPAKQPPESIADPSPAELAAEGLPDGLDDIAAATAGEPAAAGPLSESPEPTSKDPTLQPPGILLAGAAAEIAKECPADPPLPASSPTPAPLENQSPLSLLATPADALTTNGQPSAADGLAELLVPDAAPSASTAPATLEPAGDEWDLTEALRGAAALPTPEVGPSARRTRNMRHNTEATKARDKAAQARKLANVAARGRSRNSTKSDWFN